MDAAQQEKLEQLRGIVAADNGQRDIQILESVVLDVQVGICTDSLCNSEEYAESGGPFVR
jgi:hypothetical protein